MKLKDILKRINIIKLAILTAMLGAYGGQGHKKYRRIYIPLILTVLAILYLRHWLSIFIMSMAGAFSMGYGIPCPTDEDPSAIGKFWYKMFSFTDITRRNLLANVFTRGTIGLIVSSSLLPIPIIKGNWILYFIGSLLIIIGYANFAWRDLGIKYIGEKYLLWSDLIVYGAIGLVSAVMIYF